MNDYVGRRQIMESALAEFWPVCDLTDTFPF
jgi:hypothetical protein